ncbi:MAG: FKBP-type peptidyl-prolyl cis-trans isomerase [Sphingomonadales bacterium]
MNIGLRKKSRFIVEVSLLFSFVLLLGGCVKDKACVPKTVASEQATMQAYATANNMTVQAHPSGMLYQIVNAGNGATPNLASMVSVRYTGKLMNGTIFDSRTTTPTEFVLGQVITGWQLGVPLIKKGGTVRLIIPSSLAYGCTATGPIPADAVLYFEIELVDVR